MAITKINNIIKILASEKTSLTGDKFNYQKKYCLNDEQLEQVHMFLLYIQIHDQTLPIIKLQYFAKKLPREREVWTV